MFPWGWEVGVLDEQRDALAAADAGRGDAVAQPRALELARERERESHAGRTQGMADGDGAAVDVELDLVDAELARARHHLRAERFVDFEAIDIRKLEAGALEHGLDRRHRADAHDVRRYAHGGAGDNARERGLATALDVVGGGYDRRRRAVDDGRGIAAGLHPAEGGADGGERRERGGAHMGVGGKLVQALELERARPIGRALERLALDRRNLAGEEARCLGRDRALEAPRGKGIDLAPCDLVLPREVLRRV